MEDYERARRKKIQGDEYRQQVYQQLMVHQLLEAEEVSVAPFNRRIA